MRVFAIKNKKATRRFVVSVLALATLAVQPLLSLNLSAVFAAAQPSDVWIIAAMPNPVGDDKNGEYIVFENQADSVVDLSGWKISDGGTAGVLSGEIAANSTYKLCRDMSASSTAVDCDAEWSGMSLNNADDETITLTSDTSSIDEVTYRGSEEGSEVIFNTHTSPPEYNGSVTVTPSAGGTVLTTTSANSALEATFNVNLAPTTNGASLSGSVIFSDAGNTCDVNGTINYNGYDTYFVELVNCDSVIPGYTYLVGGFASLSDSFDGKFINQPSPMISTADIAINGPSSVAVGQTANYSAALTPADASGEVRWSVWSDGEGSATIDSMTGELTATSPGPITVIASMYNAATFTQNYNVNVVVDTSTTQFVGSPKYVRANNASDLSAQLVTPDIISDVRFFVNGDTAAPISGTNVGGAGAATSWWRLRTALPAGEYVITAEVEAYGEWHQISATGTVYSLDLPWAQYLIPQTNQFFRPNDRIVRVRADDEYNQFRFMKTVINNVATVVDRSACTDKGSYVLCDIQGLNLPEGTYRAVTTTYTQANNRVDNLVSESFVIDGTEPDLTNFSIVKPASVYGASVDLSAVATDMNGVKDVTFYVTTPRASDGACDGNGLHLIREVSDYGNGTVYNATLDTSSLNGDYCLNAIAKDVASNHSAISRMKVTFDNTAPIVSITAPSDDDVVNGTVTISGTVTDDNPGHYYLVIKDNAGEVIDGPETVYKTAVDVYEWDTTVVADGEYTIFLAARDAAGNKDGDANNAGVSVQSIKVTVDNTAPVVTFTLPAKGTIYAPGDVKVYGTVDTSAVGTVTVTLNSVTQDVAFDQDGNWTVVFTNLVAGQYDLSATASDAVGNIGEADVANVIVNAVGISIIVPQPQPEQRPVNENARSVTAQTPAANLTPFAFTANNLQAGNSPIQTPTSAQDEAEVLAEETVAVAVSDVKAAEVADPAVLLEEDSKQRDFSGMAYFWWLLAITTILGAVIFTIVRWRRLR